MSELHPQIISRAKPPLLTLITGANAEVQYLTLKHLESVLHQPWAKGIFEDEFRQFFVRYNEPPHVKHMKVDLLPLIANGNNARDIAAELNEYVADVDSQLSRRAIRALAAIGLRIETVAEEMTQSLLRLMEMESSYIRSETAIVLSDVVRLYPRLSDIILPNLGKYLKRVDDFDAKASLIWMLGEFGNNVQEAPYVLEQIINNYPEEPSSAIKLQLMTATMKLFFHRPAETQLMLGRLLSFGLNDTANQDLHDRALLYYRLLLNDVNASASILATGPACLVVENTFAEDKEVELKKQLFAEFNTLSIIYKMPAVQFIGEKYQSGYQKLPDAPFTGDIHHTEPVLAPQPYTIPSASAPPTNGTIAVTPHVVASVNLLDWDDTPQTVVTQQSSLREYIPDLMNPQRFQRLWLAFPESFSGSVARLTSFPKSSVEVENVLREGKIFTIASGNLPNANGTLEGYKLFVYAIDSSQPEKSDESSVLAQLQVLFGTAEVVATIKTAPGQAPAIALFNSVISSIFSNHHFS